MRAREENVKDRTDMEKTQRRWGGTAKNKVMPAIEVCTLYVITCNKCKNMERQDSDRNVKKKMFDERRIQTDTGR